MAWWPMAWPESGSWETWKDMVTNEHLVSVSRHAWLILGLPSVKTAWKPDNVSTVCQFLFYLGELGHETCWICTWNGYGDH